MTEFGDAVRRLMAERGLSLRALAKAASYDVAYLSRTLNGVQQPSPKLVAVLEQELGSRLPSSPANGQLDPDDEERLMLAARKPSRTDPRVVASLETMLAGQRRLEDAIGSVPLIEPVTAQLVVVESLVDETRGDIREDVLAVGSQWAQFAGWLNATAGNPEAARDWYDRAAEWAAETGDPDMAATVLSMKGHLAWAAGRVGPMIGLSAAALREHGASPGVRAIAAQQEGRGHALAGEADLADQRLDEAAELTQAAASDPAGQPPWVYFFSQDYLTLQRGLAYRYLRRHAEAVDLLTAGLAARPVETAQAEWMGRYVYQLASAYAAMGELEQATKTLAEARVIARVTSSSSLTAQVDRLAKRLDKRRRRR